MSEPPNPIRILVVEDQTIMREMLAEWIAANRAWSLGGACGTLAEARESVARERMDVVVLDVELPDGRGLELLDSLATDGAPAVVLMTAHEQPWLLRDAAKTAALGIVMKGAPLADLRRAIEHAARGEASYCRRTSELMRSWTMRGSPHERLTPREVEVLRLIVAGDTSRSVAEKLGIAEKTAQNHRANLMEKLEIHDVPGLVRYAIAHGLTDALR